MTDMHRKPDHPSGSAADERSSGIEERIASFAHLEENTYDAVIATDENLLVKSWNRGAVVNDGGVGVLAGYGQWVESGAKEACYRSSFVVDLSGT